MSDRSENILGVIVVLLIISILGGLIACIRVYSANQPTTYCTEWTRAVSITPTSHDDGKYSDEQYIVKYADGSITGQDQGNIPFARCTKKVRVHHTQKKSGWKTVYGYSGVDWEE